MPGGKSVELSWPAKELSPNARVHFHAKAGAAKAARAEAYWLAKHVDLRPSNDEGEIVLAIVFHPPDKRKRDLDNMLASAKPLIDGIADAMAVNDQRFAFTIRRAEPVKSGRVTVSIGEGA